MKLVILAVAVTGLQRRIELFEGPASGQTGAGASKESRLLSPELRVHFNPSGKTWRDVFGDASDEVFMAWNYARYIRGRCRGRKARVSIADVCELPASCARRARRRVSKRRTASVLSRCLSCHCALASTSIRPISTGRTLNIGLTATDSTGMRFLCRRRGWTALPITRSMPTGRRRLSAFLHSELRACNRRRAELAEPNIAGLRCLEPNERHGAGEPSFGKCSSACASQRQSKANSDHSTRRVFIRVCALSYVACPSAFDR